MSLNLSGFKKIKEDKTSAVLEHPAGHKVIIAKGVLSHGLKNQLSKLPLHQADPDDMVQDPDQDSDGNSDTPDQGTQQSDQSNGQPIPTQGNVIVNVGQPQVQPQGMSGAAQNALSYGSTNAGAGVPQPPQNISSAAPNLNTLQNPPTNPYDMPSEALKMQESGLAGQAQAESGEQQQRGQMFGAQGNAMAGLTQDQVNINNKLWKQRQDLESHVMDGHIDPMRVINNMSTGGKILTGLGFFLSGFGGPFGALGKGAMNFLNKQIDLDVQDQKQNILNRNTLLNANFQDFGTSEHAITATKGLLGDTVGSYLNQLASQTQDPVIKNKALQLGGALMNQYSGTLQQNQATQMALNQIRDRIGMAGKKPSMVNGPAGSNVPANQNQAPGQSTQSNPLDSASQIRLYQIANLMPKEAAQKATEELGTAQTTNEQAKNILDSYNDIKGIGKLESMVPFSDSKARVDSAKSNVIASFEKVMGRRIPTEQLAMMDKVFGEAGDTESQTQIKAQRMLQMLYANAPKTPTMDVYGITPPSKIDYSAQPPESAQSGFNIPRKPGESNNQQILRNNMAKNHPGAAWALP